MQPVSLNFVFSDLNYPILKWDRIWGTIQLAYGPFQNNKYTENADGIYSCFPLYLSMAYLSVLCLLLQSKNKVSLRNLSMVLRQLPVADADAHGKQVLESVDMARQAVQLDVTDGTSWCE